MNVAAHSASTPTRAITLVSLLLSTQPFQGALREH